ncbi:hypothetical protein CDEST_02839 [Colletotrichum destructivum]|uniref:Uncharacterized protein n=1 Tax=Colletotrichum destructivum TaxID=34406 RepID=A0AAX4I3G9_9PEZI|nr:hypothetical protein CDEST_02839 [Colletotrichum destructivum]
MVQFLSFLETSSPHLGDIGSVSGSSFAVKPRLHLERGTGLDQLRLINGAFRGGTTFNSALLSFTLSIL